jgi:hypothetical protein
MGHFFMKIIISHISYFFSYFDKEIKILQKASILDNSRLLTASLNVYNVLIDVYYLARGQY